MFKKKNHPLLKSAAWLLALACVQKMKTLSEPRKANVGKSTAGLEKHVIYLFLPFPLNFHNGLQANSQTTSFECRSHISCSHKMKSYRPPKKLFAKLQQWALGKERRVTSFWYKSNLCISAAWHVANKTSHAWAIKLNLCYLFKACFYSWYLYMLKKEKEVKQSGGALQKNLKCFFSKLPGKHWAPSITLRFILNHRLLVTWLFFFSSEMYQPLQVTGVPQLAFWWQNHVWLFAWGHVLNMVVGPQSPMTNTHCFLSSSQEKPRMMTAGGQIMNVLSSCQI